MIKQLGALVLIMLSVVSVTVGQLNVGDIAPPLVIQTWLKGEPVNEFSNGRTYVVEFSGTWCAPCRKAIPHMTGLSKLYEGRVTFISVFLEKDTHLNLEDLTYIEKVKSLIGALGPKIEFSVAVDVPSRTTMKTWGITAIPKAFLIDSSGQIGWIGSPFELGPILKLFTSGIFDPSDAERKQKDLENLLANISKENINVSDDQIAIREIDSLINIYPENSLLYFLKYKTLLQESSSKGYSWLKWILDSNIVAFDWAYIIGYGFRDIPPEERNYAIELEVLDRSITESELDYIAAYQMYLKADTYATMSDYTNAIVWCEKAIEYNQVPWRDSLKILNYSKQLFNNSLIKYKYFNLANHSPEKARAWLKSEVTSNSKISLDLINAILKAPRPDYHLALELINNALKYSQDARGNFLEKKSTVYASMGDFKKAIDAGEEAIDELKKAGRSAAVKNLEERIQMYQKLKK